MAISAYNIKKWYRMLTGKSILHVNQNMGTQFSTVELKGYFNNLTEKVLKEPELLDTEDLPTSKTETGESIIFPVAIFQYGLGAYDLYLDTNEDKYLTKFIQCSNWALNNQEDSGAWSNFSFIYPENPYGAMCQGEGASLLIRAFCTLKDEKYKNAAFKALNFMLKPVEEEGTSQYGEDGLILLEYMHLPAVLNGWIFALFGLYDYLLIENVAEFHEALDSTLTCLKKFLVKFDCGFWSLYDLNGMMASPFYHNLHIAQMHALSLIDDKQFFEKYEYKFIKYNNSKINKLRAFAIKAYQKIKE